MYVCTVNSHIRRKYIVKKYTYTKIDYNDSLFHAETAVYLQLSICRGMY